MGRSKRQSTEVNAGSMADIAFLLLIFFLVTTTIASDKGIYVQLPPKKEEQQEIKLKQRNIFNILINSQDKMLVEEEPLELSELKETVKEFITNNGKDPKSSESPQKAVVSLKTDRGTSYEQYILVVDELKQAYNELRAEYLGITLEEFNELDRKTDEGEEMYDRARQAFPYQVSDAEPTDINIAN
ncbi:ExbD/TolR family protein [Flexithrix dorotheae]|uniref:ExbD/TolR family protein n=1 Tax=Flexithrix dorotheae TaxID=70993 RepID=UPI00037EA8A6|nr:biopolymer transporter ExbD [Flexithrix dorotheae]